MYVLALLALACAPKSPPGTTPVATPAVSYGPAPMAVVHTSEQTAVNGDPITTASGLKYWVIAEGTGPVPAAGQRAAVHYTGWLADGTRFDSSHDRGQPLELVVGAGQVIKGWDEAVSTMRVGERRRLEIPPELGYGPRGAGGRIPGGATLVFEVELVAIR